MTLEIAIVLGLLAVGIALFSTEVLSVDVVTLLLLAGLVISDVLTPREAFAGFGSDLILTLGAIFVLSGALQQTGAVSALAEWLEARAGRRESRLLLILAAAVGVISSLLNNTTATAVFLPATLKAAHRLRIDPARLLMPVAFASILGGTCTLIGTSTNLAASGFLEASGLEPLGLFELTPVGLVLLPVGLAYLVLVGRRLIPLRAGASLTDAYAMRDYLSEVVVMDGSPVAGQRVFTSELSRLGFQVLEVHRGRTTFLPTAETHLAAGDLLLVKGPAEELMRVKATTGLEMRADLLVRDSDLQPADVRIAEVLVAPGSNLVGRTLKDARFRQRFGVTALALHRRGQPRPAKLGQMRLELGDLLLVQGPGDRLEALRRNPNVWVVERDEPVGVPRPRQGLVAVTALVGAVVASGLGWLPISVAFLLAAVVAVAARAITTEEAYRSVEWRLMVLIGGMTAFGTAMESTGAADYLASVLIQPLVRFGPHALLAGFALLTIALTQPMSNAAAALVVLPVALSTAAGLGADPRPFAIAVTLAASISFITPFEPSCLLVYGPGRYRFRDFPRVGAPLTLLLLGIVLFLVPRLWPF
ncbi:MAG TPA: SLC13 family permease [Thermoanaerobaculia bacterium]|nr:SLC13 family permease [Thermoanaerobaculia bacterium]